MKAYQNMTEAYPHIIEDILKNGNRSSPRGMPIKEILGYSFCLDNYDQPSVLQKSRGLNYKFGMLEGLLNLYGQYPPEIVLHFVKRLKNYMNDEGGWDGAYAPRLNKSLENVYRELGRDRDSRRAVLPIYSWEDSTRFENSKDIPCTLTIQFLIRNHRLNMIVNMRSNDVLWGLPNDVVQFATMGKALAGWLNIETGMYIHNAGSMHSYDEREGRLWNILQAKKENTETYADIIHPSWENMTYEKSMLEIGAMMMKLQNYVKDEELNPMLGPFSNTISRYWLYLTDKTDINFK